MTSLCAHRYYGGNLWHNLGGVCLPSVASNYLHLEFPEELRSPYFTNDLPPEYLSFSSGAQFDRLFQHSDFLDDLVDFCTEACSCLSRGDYRTADQLSKERALGSDLRIQYDPLRDGGGLNQGQLGEQKESDSQEDTGILIYSTLQSPWVVLIIGSIRNGLE